MACTHRFFFGMYSLPYHFPSLNSRSFSTSIPGSTKGFLEEISFPDNFPFTSLISILEVSSLCNQIPSGDFEKLKNESRIVISNNFILFNNILEQQDLKPPIL